MLERNVVESIGWWKCSLHGRQGLAPANRLAPLSPAEAEKVCANLNVQKDYLSNHSHQNIYQTPKATRPPENHIYEEMNAVYKVPLQANPSPDKHKPQEDPERTRSPHEVSLSAHFLLPRVSFMFYAIVSSFVWIWLVQQHWNFSAFQTVSLSISGGEDYFVTISSGSLHIFPHHYTCRWQ